MRLRHQLNSIISLLLCAPTHLWLPVLLIIVLYQRFTEVHIACIKQDHVELLERINWKMLLLNMEIGR